MAELFASLSDINAHLPSNVQANDGIDDSLQVDASRLIRGQLVSIFTPEILLTWDNPSDTPELIRGIAGRLIASKYYARLFAGETADKMPDYAVSLYGEAISLLSDIKSGAQIVVDASGNPLPQDDIGADPTTDMFPLDTGSTGPVFTMGRSLSGDTAIGTG